jgi:hypothetical protein
LYQFLFNLTSFSKSNSANSLSITYVTYFWLSKIWGGFCELNAKAGLFSADYAENKAANLRMRLIINAKSSRSG